MQNKSKHKFSIKINVDYPKASCINLYINLTQDNMQNLTETFTEITGPFRNISYELIIRIVNSNFNFY